VTEQADLQPDVDEVLQAEAPELTTIPVSVAELRGPVRVQQLPRKAAATMTRRLTTAPGQILRADHRRASAVLVAPVGFLVAFSETACQAPSAMAYWPADTPLTIGAAVEVWALILTPGVGELAELDRVSVVTEHWAVGE